MERLVIQTRKFSEILDNLVDRKKLSKKDFEAFESKLVSNPEMGEVIQGAGGLRKTRLRSPSRGKSGGFRICYCDVPEKGKLFLVAIFPKNVQENLSQEEKKILRSLVDRLKKE